MNKLYIMLITLFGDLEERANSLQDRAHEDRGAAMVEYGLLVAFIALIVLAGVTLLGGNLGKMFTSIGNKIPTA